MRNIAMFVDGYNLSENDISEQDIDHIISEISHEGSIIQRRIYGNLQKSEYHKWQNKGFMPIFLPVKFEDKTNAAYITITIDVIRTMANNREINAVCLFSTNYNFEVLASNIKESGIYVIGAGRDIFLSNSERYYDQYLALKNLDVNGNPVAFQGLSKASIFEILKYGMEHSLTNDTGWIKINDFIHTIRKNYADLDNQVFRQKSVIDLVKSHGKDFLINFTNNGIFFQKAISENSVGIINNCSDSYGFIKNDLGIFYFAGNSFNSGNLSNKMAKKKVKFKIYKHPDLTKTAHNERNGRAGEVELIE